MFLAATDQCALCKTSIYPDDKKLSSGLDRYHYECAKNAHIDIDEGE